MADKTGYIGRNPADTSVIIARQTFEPSTSTTDFTFAAGYTVGYLDLYVNGAKQIEGRDYNANDGSTAVLVSAATSGDVVEIIAYKAFNVGDAASSSTGNFAVGNDLSVNNDAAVSQNLNVTGVTTTGLGLNVSAGGANISGVVTATSYQGDGSALTGIAATDTIAAASLTVSGITTLSNELIVKQGGIEVDEGGLDIVGIVTFASHVEFDTDARITGNINAGIATFGAVTVTSITGDGSGLTGVANTDFISNVNIVSTATTTSRLVVGSGVTVAGIATASSFDGAISEWTLVSGDGSNYAIKGPGLTGSENDPTLYLKRGQRYNFKNSTGGHPFRIQSTPNGATGTQYNDGVTNNDAGDGTTLIFDVQHDAPSRLYYQCTSHPSMGGTLVIDTGYSSYDANGFEVVHAGTASTSRFLAGGSVGVGIGVTTTTGRDAAAGVGTVTGQIVFNETTGAVECYTGTSWQQLSNVSTATGGDTTAGVAPGNGYQYHVWTSPGTLVVEGGSITADMLLVAGGGGGAGGMGGHNHGGGGGGAGGIAEVTAMPLDAGTYPITVPTSNASGGNGQTSTNAPQGSDGGNVTVANTPVGTITAEGGGGGGTGPSASTGRNGGSGGGGGSFNNSPGGSATQPGTNPSPLVTDYGNAGGVGGDSSADASGGGGGGANGAGGSTSEPNVAGNGGNGRPFSNYPYPLYSAIVPSPFQPNMSPSVGPTGLFGGGGGGGKANSGSGGNGGPGGGGSGGLATGSKPGNAAQDGTGGGGGGGGGGDGGEGGNGGQGGRGIVIMRLQL